MSGPLTDLGSPSCVPAQISFAEIASALKIAGFPAVGAVDYPLALPLYQEHAKRYEAWIREKKHGEMAYLERGLARRLDPRLVFPELKSVIAVLLPYSPHPVGSEGMRYARYLNGPDYHETIHSQLERALQKLRNDHTLPDSFRYKICVDTSAVLERSWAMLCGLGWIGKNTLLIHPQLGSYVFVGVVFTNAELGIGPEVLKDYCGSCTRCISACPTQALAPRNLDANACISYLTLEKRGEWERKFETKGFLAGCDLCQEACPYNTKSVKATPATKVSAHLQMNEKNLLNETEIEYRARVMGTALSRVKFADFKRNLAAAVGKPKPPN